MFCWSAKFLGEKKVYFSSDWDDGHDGMVKKMHDLYSQADAVVTYNGDKFDIPKLHGEFILAGLKAPPQATSIDVIKTVRKFGFLMNRLAFVGPLLGIGQKVKHEGFDLWVKVINGDNKAREKMKKYNIQDVILLEKLYLKILPFVRNHPHLGKNKQACGACDGTILHSRGFRRTKSFKIQRLQCQKCGSWQDGKREKVI